jgi:predicted nucleotidyltransferase
VKEKRYADISTPWLKNLVTHPMGALGLHWIVQGLLYMDRTERGFKIGLDLLGTLMIGRILQFRLPRSVAYSLGFLIAHTLNFLFNGHVLGVLKHFGGIQNTRSEFDREVENLRKRLAEEPSIVYAAAYGSLARGEWSTTSDLDVRLVRAPGIRNGWRASLFVLRARTQTLFTGFPIDIFVFDNYANLNRMRENAYPVILKGKR